MNRPPRPPPRRLRIDWKVVEQRRIAVGLTSTELAARVGGGGVFGSQRLWHDSDHDRVSLGLLERLCQVLDLHPVELFTPPTRAPQRRRIVATPHRHDAAPDDTVLEAALAAVAATRTAHSGAIAGPGAASIGRSQLATALGWPLARLDAATAALEERLTNSGIRLADEPDPAAGVSLRPRDALLTAAQRQALHQLRTADHALPESTARALHFVISPGCEPSENTIALGPDAAIELQQQGYARRRTGGMVLDPSPDVAFSLLFDDDPAGAP